MKKLSQVLAVLVLLVAPLQANQDGIIVRQATVYAAASSVAGKVGKLAAGTRVSVFGRKGGWKEIFSEKSSVVGWVRSYQVREGDFTPAAAVETEADSRGFLSGLAALSRKASGYFKSASGSTSSGTATIGVRGLSEDEIRGAVADFEELKKMTSFASNPQRIALFASQGRLKAIAVPHL